MIQGLRSLLKRLGSLRDPKPYTLAEWTERHREVVRRDVERILPYVPEDGLFLDVGANVGLFTEAILEQRPNARAILFEPVQLYYDHCMERLGDRANVTIHRLALSDSDETRSIFKAKHNYGANSVMKEIMFDRRDNAMVRPDTVVEEELIECRRLDSFAPEHDISGVDFIKTDTEGFDYAVLGGMLGFLEGCEQLPVILSELLEESYHPCWDQQLAAVRKLEALGYEPVDLSNMATVDDILFVPKGRRVDASGKAGGDSPASGSRA
ncbi:MAG: FkbM family methyltransferase [Planctomycetota bacterium]|jgi:FkbM family methyltransferase